MDRRSVRTFSRRFKEELERYGIVVLERFDWAMGFRELGFEMDCGQSYEEAYGLSLGNNRDIDEGLSRVNDMTVLGNAIFSQCRYLALWSGGHDEEDVAWLIAAPKRLEELIGPEKHMRYGRNLPFR